MKIMERKLGEDNVISRSLTVLNNSSHDGRTRYSRELRHSIYAHLLETIRRYQPDLTCSLCMEDIDLAKYLGLSGNIGSCNCVL